MYHEQRVIDVHGHMSTPPEFNACLATTLISNTPTPLSLTDERLDTAVSRHIKYMDDRDIDLQFISPRPNYMAHWLRPTLQDSWCRITNDTIAQICRMYPDRYLGIAQLPQNAGIPTDNCVEELERSVSELKFVGACVTPDPDGNRAAPGVHEKYWYPLYEKAQALKAPLIIHPSVVNDPRVGIIQANYQIANVTEEFIATQLYEHSTVFDDFPDLKVIVCHCGGALPRFIPEDNVHLGQKDLRNNLYFDSCVYQQDLLAACFKTKGVDRILFGTEAPGSGGAVRSDTGLTADNLVPVIDALDFLTMEDKMKIFRGNAKSVFELLDPAW